MYQNQEQIAELCCYFLQNLVDEGLDSIWVASVQPFPGFGSPEVRKSDVLRFTTHFGHNCRRCSQWPCGPGEMSASTSVVRENVSRLTGDLPAIRKHSASALEIPSLPRILETYFGAILEPRAGEAVQQIPYQGPAYFTYV